MCKYFLNFSKFGKLCAFLHGLEKQTDTETIRELEQEIQHLNTKISQVETILSKLDKIEDEIRSMEKAMLKTVKKLKKW